MAPAPRPRTKPLLRGVSHELAAYLSVPAVVSLVAAAGSGVARVAALAYGASLVTLLSVSALYHRPWWPPRARGLVGRCDHAAIFVLIAGTYTPFCLVLGPGAGHGLLAAVWGGAALGVALALAWEDAPKVLMAGVYVAFGWIFMATLPAMRAAVGDATVAWVLAGGLIYTAGAAVYASRRPDPFPAVFGYHEIFHLLVVVAAICHYAAVDRAVAQLRVQAPPALAAGARPAARPPPGPVLGAAARTGGADPERARR
ncbi:MAG: hemolysin III family protein [Anaeromyxobacter sp.]